VGLNPGGQDGRLRAVLPDRQAVPENPIPSRRPEDVTEGQAGVKQIAMRGSKEAEFRATCIRLCRFQSPRNRGSARRPFDVRDVKSDN
jgi:hypothetical protein